MAAELNSSEDILTLEDDNLETTDELSLTELNERLGDIHISIESILRENKETRNEVVQLKETVLEPPGGGVLGSIFAGYGPQTSPNPYPIVVYSVANYRPHLSHF